MQCWMAKYVSAEEGSDAKIKRNIVKKWNYSEVRYGR